LTPRQHTIVLCDAYGWTLDQVRAQPAAFIRDLIQFRNIRASFEADRASSAERFEE
jgi:hypothetical protein